MIANGISSLRSLGRMDWRLVFERVSLVEEILRGEQAGVYSQMDFGTRDRYRHIVEEMERGSDANELEVARAAVEAARSSEADAPEHVGYYLIGAGRPLLEARVGYRPTVGRQLGLSLLRRPAMTYLGGIALGTVAILAVPLAFAISSGAALLWVASLAALWLLALVPASELATQVVNFVVSTALRPQPLPKLDFTDGVPDEWRTLVGVPTLLVSPQSIQDDLDQLEVRYLANPDANLRFALLADLTDAAQQERPEDAALVAAAVRGIEGLNARYTGGRFALFFRPRRWSETEHCWMGWERKRGKLEELNSWLLGEGGTCPHTLRPVAGDPSQLVGIKLVITLDADTQLPHGTGRRLIGTMAHPLNRPRLAPDGRTVVGGYTIIQPRVSPSLPSATGTRFARIFADSIGVDPYSQVVSDLYQDLAGEGSYYGKGIYDVRVFHDVLGGRFPPATLLSHDLLEGAYVRVGIASDIELSDTFPSSYLSSVQRQHRWIRGDWQIAAWGGASVPTAEGRHEPNPIGALNRWKILDNLRRSLIPVTSVGLLLASWAAGPGVAAFAGLLVALSLLLPSALRLGAWVPTQSRAVLVSGRAWRDQGIAWLRVLIGAALLAHQAFVSLDAISRTLYRNLVSRRDRLEWQTFKAGGRKRNSGERRLGWHLALVSLASMAAAAALVMTNPATLPAATPYLLLWTLSPIVAAWLAGARGGKPEHVFSGSDRQFLRRVARETWRYFHDFVGPESNWLPPDNCQEVPRMELAERTSPTNIGLWLLATLAARDFGYLTPVQVIKCGEATLDTLERLERFEGHFLNWYHTGTLAPLRPRYVSTVDRGNLVASLWTLAQGYREMLSRPMIGPEALDGLADTLALVVAHQPSSPGQAGSEDGGRVGKAMRDLSKLSANPPRDPARILRRLGSALGPARELADLLRPGTSVPHGRLAQAEEASAAYWASQLESQVQAWLDVSPPADLKARLDRLIERVEWLAEAMNMGFLYDQKRRLFAIGYNVDDRRFDSSYYDLLASEARVASLVAIARARYQPSTGLPWGGPLGKLRVTECSSPGAGPCSSI